MSKEIQDVAAASSTAPTPTETVQAEPSTAGRIAQLHGDDLNKYQLTGELPELPKPATTAKAEEPKAAPESGPDHLQEPKEDRIPRTWREQRRIGELSVENRRLQRELEALRASKPNAEIPARTEKPAHSSLVEPDIADFSSTDEFKKANTAYLRAVAKEEALALEKERRDTEATREAELELAEDNERFESREEVHVKASQNYLAAKKAVVTALNQVFDNAPDRYVDRFLIRSEYGPALVDHLYTNPDQFKRLLTLPRDEALVLLGKIEDRVEAAIKKAPKPNTVSKAADPPVKLGGKDESVDGPPVGSQAWMDAENARDVARMGR